LAYSLEIVRVPPEEMQMVGLAVLRRAGERTVIYCRADQISAEVAQSLSDKGTRFSQATIRYDHPVSPRRTVQFRRLDPAEMPEGVPSVSTVRDGGTVGYFRADMITDEMAHALELICAEQTRYLVRLPVISPPVPGTTRPAS